MEKGDARFLVLDVNGKYKENKDGYFTKLCS